MCIFTVKSVIKYYTEQNTAVYTCLLDARKAFDRVNHWTLFAKLIHTQAPLLIVRVLLFWYQMQNVCIKWGHSYSHYFTICNGVRRGGILSPRLLALYVNQLTDRLLSCNVGCYINDMGINHVMYADDICLLAPSASSMQSLLDVCYDYGSDNDILFNPIKSVYTIFKPKAYKLYLPPVFIGSDALKYVAESKYLGFSFCDSKQDDNDILRQMRTVYAKSNTLLRTFSHCSTDVKVTYFKVIALHYIVRFAGVITRNQHLERFVLHLIMRIEKSLIFPRRVMPVLCMLNIIFVTLKQRYGKAYMVLCRDWKTALTLLFVLCIIHV